MYRKEVLPNGVRIVTHEMPYMQSVSMAISVGTGSRHEGEEEAGLSHFLEHMLFKGTRRRPTPRAISWDIESAGGLLDANTYKEFTNYSCRVAKAHFPIALDVLSDMILNSLLDAEEIDRERGVVIEELHMCHDDSREWVDILTDELVWPDQALGRDIAGREETISRFTHDSALEYMARQYAPSNTVVSVAGNISHDSVVEQVAAAMGHYSGDPPAPFLAAEEIHSRPRLKISERKTEQAHLCLAAPGLPSRHPDRFVLDLLDVVLGDGMGSRLFLELREKRGLAYEVSSQVTDYADTGSVTVYAGVAPRRTEETVSAVLEQMQRLCNDKVSDEELARAKGLEKGRHLLRMESTLDMADWMGEQELLLGRIPTVGELLGIIDDINAGDLQRVARSLFVRDRLCLAMVGPLKHLARFERLLNGGTSA